MRVEIARGKKVNFQSRKAQGTSNSASKRRTRVRGTISFLTVFILWEAVGQFIVTNPLFFVPISAVVSAGWDLALSGQLWRDTRVTLIESVIGFSLAMTLGIAIGALLAISKRMRDYADPWVSALYATPIIALGPIFILWFGLGITSKVMVILLMAIFPFIINTQAGLTNTDSNLIDAARSFGASKWQVFTKVQIPSSLPYITAGARNGIARALVGAVVAEFFGSREGLGHLIFVSSQTFATANLFVGVFLLAGFGIGAVGLLKLVEKKLAPWKQGEEEGH